ncbi:MAG: hypothetical protein Q4B13_03400 [Lautropia sp.]|nr:hypothetical protein [Lautropia sp.]
MTKNRICMPLAAGMLAILQAACGGGGGGEPTAGQAVSASPSAPTPEYSLNTGVTTSDQTPATTDTSSATAAEPSDATATTTTTPVPVPDTTHTAAANTTPVPPISAKGVRGEVLLSMLDQRPCDNYGVLSSGIDGNALPLAQDETPEVTFSTTLHQHGDADASGNYVQRPGSTRNPLAAPNAVCHTDQMYAPAKPGTTYELHESSGPVYRFTPESVKYGFHYLTALLSLRVSNDEFRLGNTITLNERQDLGRAYRAANPDTANQETSQTHTLTAPDERIIRNDALVPFGMLQEWKQGNMLYQIMLLASDKPQQAKLCWNASLTYVKRLHCTVWDVPTNFRQGSEMRVQQYLVDDRSTYTELEKGTAIWRAGNN